MMKKLFDLAITLKIMACPPSPNPRLPTQNKRVHQRLLADSLYKTFYTKSTASLDLKGALVTGPHTLIYLKSTIKTPPASS